MEGIIISIGILGGYFITKRVINNREIENIILKKESEYNTIRSKLILENNELILEYDKKMSDLKSNIKKYFSIWSSNKNVIDFYNKISDKYIDNLKAYLPKEEA